MVGWADCLSYSKLNKMMGARECAPIQLGSEQLISVISDIITEPLCGNAAKRLVYSDNAAANTPAAAGLPAPAPPVSRKRWVGAVKITRT